MNATFHTVLDPCGICLGTANMGTDISVKDSYSVLDTYFELGGNFVDTAHIYAAWVENGWGVSERTLGEWIKSNGVRKQIILATKGGHPPMDKIDGWRCGPDDLLHDLEESLDRLQTDFIDVYWLHRDDPTRDAGEIIATLADILVQGLIGAYGASNWSTERIDEANTYAKEKGLPPFVASQPGWSLADRAPDAPMIPGLVFVDEPIRRWHRQRHMAMVPYTAQATGYFGEANVAWAKAGFLKDPPRGRDYDTIGNRKRLLECIKIAEYKHCTPNQVALAYLRNQRFPVFPIVGTGKPEHIRESLGALEVTLSITERKRLRTIGEDIG